MKHRRNINSLVHDRLIGSISEEDRAKLQSWLDESPQNRTKYDRFLNESTLTDRYKTYSRVDEERAWLDFQKKHSVRHSFRWSRVARYAAAIMLPLVGVAVWLWISHTEDTKPVLSHETRVAMIRSEQVGRHKATLELSDGRKVEIQSAPSAPIQHPIALPIDDANVAKDSKIEKDEKELQDNKLTTRNDSEFWMTFEDGTRVHLNYNTMLRYPSRFGSHTRTVYVDGEAYFEVAKDKKRPFRVVTKHGIVRQYGTSFNVNTQGGTDTKVVLVEGSISVMTHKGQEFEVKPGELAVLKSNKEDATISKVEIEPYIAWNKGRFVFNNCSLKTLMNVMSDWYGKEVLFESEDIKRIRFTGDIDRYQSVEPILKAIKRVTGLEVEVTEERILLKKHSTNH